jgi:N-acetylneuraminate synthase
MPLKIGSYEIGPGQRPFIIAELSGNHNQKLSKALELVKAAAKAGAHAIKLQTYTADTMTLALREGDFLITERESLWYGRSLYDLYQEAHTPWEWHESIFHLARELDILCFSTPFDASAVDFLEQFNPPCYKIASFEIVDLSLIEKVAKTGKPLIISTGMATLAEIDEAVRTARDSGAKDIVLLKCTSSYPATPADSNIATIPHMRQLFSCEIGLSDHTPGIGAAVASVALGATVIEKHFTFSRADGGVDAAFSLEPYELEALVIETERAWQSIGKISYGLTEKEKDSIRFRRSLYVAKDMRAGEPFTEKNLRIIRPGFGLPPKYIKELLGKKIRKDARQGTPVKWELLD